MSCGFLSARAVLPVLAHVLLGVDVQIPVNITIDAFKALMKVWYFKRLLSLVLIWKTPYWMFYVHTVQTAIHANYKTIELGC